VPQPDIAATIGDGDAEVALRSLSLSDRQLITLRVIEGFSEKDTAAILNITVGTAKSRLSRAKKRLSAHLTHTPSTTLMTEVPHAQ
jgi:RNA polymerase sigma-70 factor (ECF subfamily)